MTWKNERLRQSNLMKRGFFDSRDRVNFYNSFTIQNNLDITSLRRSLARKVIGRVVCVIVVLLVLLGPGFAWGGDSTLSDILSLTWPDETNLPDRLMVRGGYGYVFGANTTLRANGPAGIGTTIDFENTLGGETEGSLGRADLLFRFNSNHATGFTWYKLSRNGIRTIQQDFNWEGLTYRAGASVTSNLDIELYRLWYMWSFYRGEKMEVAISPGVYVAKVDASLTGTLTVADTAGAMVAASAGTGIEDLTLPLPSLGLIMNYNLTPRLTANVRGDGFYLKVGEYEGFMSEAYLGLDYRILKNFSLGAAYDFFAVNVQRNATTKGWKVDNFWHLVYLYGSLYFFDTPLSQ